MSAFINGLVKLVLKSPDWLLLKLSGKPQQTCGDRKVLPAFQLVCSLMDRAGPSIETLPPAEARSMQDDSPIDFDPPPPGVTSEDHRVPVAEGEITVRAYTPPGAAAVLPALVYFHGGGWVLGGLDSHHGTCSRLSAAAGCRVFSVDYRMAPEHRFPTALEDCDAAFSWVLANADRLGVDPARVAAGGDSAGGNLTAALCIKRKAATAPLPRVQLLIYPATEFSFDRPSFEECGEGFFLTRAMMEWFRGHYLPNEADWRNPLAAPLHAESVAGHPPAILATAGFDPLRDEGNAYGEKLKADGVEVEMREYESMIHGFVSMGLIPQAREAVEGLGQQLARRLA